MHLGASSAFGVIGRHENASPMTASALGTFFWEMLTPGLRGREWGVQDTGFTHLWGMLNEGRMIRLAHPSSKLPGTQMPHTKSSRR